MPVRLESSSANLRPLPQTGGSVTVQSGDTLSKLAQRAGVSVDALVAANTSKYPSLATNRNAIQVGWSLQVPGGTTPPPPTQSTTAGWQNTGRTTATQATGTTTRPNDIGAKMAAGGAQSIAMRTQKHLDAIEKTGVGTYFGDHSSWKTMSAEEKTQWIAENTKPGVTPPSASSIKEASCIGWAMENVGAAYAAAGKSERWAQIMKTVVANGSKGTDLAKELKKDGWQSIYWNPDAKNPNDGNPEHSFSAVQVAKGKGYSIINGQRFDWQEHDIFCVPSWMFHEHANASQSEDACLFCFNDMPVMNSLGIYREEALAENGGHQKV